MDLRRLPRPRLSTTLDVQDQGKVYAGQTVNISLTGMMCEVPVEYTSTRPILITFRLGANGYRVATWATPIWSHRLGDGRYRIGLEFINLDSAHYTAIADFVADAWLSGR